MRALTGFTLSIWLIGHAQAHYIFSRLIVNNTESKDYEFIRPHIGKGTEEDYYGVLVPNQDPTFVSLRCGANGTQTGNITKTITIHAGDKVGFRVGEPHFKYANYPYDIPRTYHPGPGSAWLSKAPNDDLDSYTGDGDWFKILEVVGRTEQSMPILPDPTYKHLYQWGLYLSSSWNFTIPATTPPGKYLLRFEQVFPWITDSVYKGSGPEYFANCAQVNIINEGTVGTPQPLVKIPGVYTPKQPEFEIDIWDKKLDVGKFKYPKPSVWKG